MKRARRDRGGFTLIELLIVVVVIGILASIAIPKFSEVRRKAFLATIGADLRNLAAMQEIYFNQHYTFSTSAADLGFVASEGVVITFTEATVGGWSAQGTHLGLTGTGGSCAVYHGDAAAVAPATVVSIVTCTN